MERTLRELRGVRVLARDGPAGVLKDLYFDDDDWAVRELRLDAGAWLPGRLVLIPVASVQRVDPTVRAIILNLSRDQVSPCAGIDDLDARSAVGLLGYRLEATDGPIGRIDDLMVNDAGWSLTSLVVDTRDLLPGTAVRIAPAAVAAIDFVGRTVRLRMTRDQVRRAPRAK